LLSGNVFANAMAVAVIVAIPGFLEGGQLNFLIYDAKHQKYLKHVMEFRNNGRQLVFVREEK